MVGQSVLHPASCIASMSRRNMSAACFEDLCRRGPVSQRVCFRCLTTGRKVKSDRKFMGAANANLGVPFFQLSRLGPEGGKIRKCNSSPDPPKPDKSISKCLASVRLLKRVSKSTFSRRALWQKNSKIRSPFKYDNLKFVKMFCVFEKVNSGRRTREAQSEFF